VKARALRWTFSVFAAAILGCDAAPSDPVERLRQVFAERPDVPYSDNAFLDLLGFLGPAGVDPHELGIRRVVWLEKLDSHPEGAGTDPGTPTLDPKLYRSQALTQVIDACRDAIARACDSALDRVKGEAPLSHIESLLIARYDMLLSRRGWREIGVTQPAAQRVPYEGAIEAQRFMLIRLRNVASAGDVESVRAVLTRDLTFWRTVLGSSDTLFSKMMALAAIRQHFTFGSFVLRDLPKARAMEAIPAQWRNEFTLRERSMLRPMAGELMIAEELLQTGKGKVLVSSEPEPDGALDKLSPRIYREPTISEIADTYLSVAEAFQVPLPEYEGVAARTHGKHASDMGRGVSQYALRVGSAEGMRRAALLTVELRSQSVPVALLPERLQASPLRNPYNGQPFAWDPADRAVVFIGPERRDFKRQAYPY